MLVIFLKNKDFKTRSCYDEKEKRDKNGSSKYLNRGR
jgi:hypothetical protein